MTQSRLTAGESESAATPAKEFLVYVKGTTDPVLDCWLADEPACSFLGDGAIISYGHDASSELAITVQIANIDRMELKDNITGSLSGIAPTEAGGTLRFICTDGRRATIDGITDGQSVDLYDAGGRRLPAAISHQGRRATIDLGSLPAGVYMLYVAGHSFKFNKK